MKVDYMQATAFMDEVKQQFNIYLNEVALFEINNKTLRNKIQSELQEWADILVIDVRDLFSSITVKCNEMNNDSEIIDTNQLIVDVIFKHAVNNTSIIMTLRVGKKDK